MAYRHQSSKRDVARSPSAVKLFSVLQRAGVSIPPFFAEPHLIADIGLPAVVMAEPWGGGNGFRAVIARYSDIAPAFATAYVHSPLIMVQRYAEGHEIACGVMEYDGALSALMPIDVIPRARGEHIPWHLSEWQIEEIRAHAVLAHRAVGAGTYSCVRFVVEKRAVFVVGIACVPLLTPHSLFLESAAVVGFTRAELITLL